MARNRYRRTNWGFVVVAGALALAAALITFAQPLWLADVPTWEQILEKPSAAAPSDIAPGDAPSADPSVRVHIIDVGQGDCILIQTAQSNVLIDAGTPDAASGIIRYLQERGVLTLDLVIATHPHADHIGGMAAVLQRVDVKQVVAPRVPEALGAAGYSYEKMLTQMAKSGLKPTPAAPGDVYELGGARLTILGPVEPDSGSMNNNSVVARLDCGETSFLFAGDMERDGERALLQSGAPLSADVLKAGHHGSKTSTGNDFLDAVNPRWAVISCALDNNYGHPHRQVLDRLEGMGAAVYRTDLDGSVVFRSNGETVSVHTENEETEAAA